jgi:hypothetical protein
MMANRNNVYTAVIDVDTNAVGFVLGKGRQNLNNLKQEYPDVKIWMTQNGPLTAFNLSSNSVNKLEQCQEALEKLKYNGESVHHSIVQRKRVTKNIESQRQTILAGKRIRDALEDEMRSKHRDEVQRKIVSNLALEQDVSNDNNESVAVNTCNMFGGLEVE